MIIEHVVVHIAEGRTTEFEQSLKQAFPIITSAPGCHGAEARRQLEDEHTYLMLIKWDSLTDHMDFRKSDLFAKWKDLTWTFYDRPAEVSHFYLPFLSHE